MISRNTIFVLIVMIIAMSCSAKNNQIPEGDFLRGIGNKIYIVNFEKQTNKLFYEFPRGTILEDKIYQVDSKTLLLSLPEEGKILTMDIKSKQIKNIGIGIKPMYMPEHKKIVYYGKDDNGKPAILLTDMSFKQSKFIMSSTRYDRLLLVKISSDEVVFQKSDYNKNNPKKKNRRLWKFNVVSSELSKLEAISDCMLLNLWREETKQLLCMKILPDRADSYYFLVDLVDKKEIRLDHKGSFHIGEYLTEMDAVILQKVRVNSKRNEVADLWIYKFNDNSSYKIMEHAGFAIDSFMRIKD